ncbi:MAG: flagellar basal body L-ring protein FlgH [Beijerinckiaceae bacterium]|nr:flagellar basal body L-ring protein FlgH [Beijerinckiaceae bacterium]
MSETIERKYSISFIICWAIALSACATNISDIGVAPQLTPVRAEHLSRRTSDQEETPITRKAREASLWNKKSPNLFGDQRSSSKGDIFTINIAINDKAQIGNTTDRNQESQIKGALNYATNLLGLAALGAASGDIASKSSSKGEGAINRSEKIQLNVAAIISDVLPNGNLYINGSQEIRVNFELRVLEISGIVRPIDITKDNTISYDKIAEARVSYGGRGRLMEVQQPRLIHQMYDNLRPL